MRYLAAAVLLVLACADLAWAGKEFQPPHANEAKTYPAHEAHPEEQVTVAIDPYDTPAKTGIFKVDWQGHGYLPVFFVVTNDGDEPVSLQKMKVEWVTARRTKLQPASDAELARRLSQVKNLSTNTFPVPLPRKNPERGLTKEARQEIDRAQFRALTVAPHSTQSGFLFFDVAGISQPIAGAHVYVEGLQNSQGKELFYFEIPLPPPSSPGISSAN